jgi:hypothetical protein
LPQIYKPLAIDEALVKYVMPKQGKQTTPAEFLEQFKNHMNMHDAMGATIRPHIGVQSLMTQGEREPNVVDKAYYGSSQLQWPSSTR